MSKTTKQIKKELTAEETLLKDTVERINVILKETGTVLQPYMDYQEFGVVPRVRINLPKKEEDLTKTV